MKALPLDVDDLRELVRAGHRPNFLFFWGHAAKSGTLGRECLSQWYPAPFTLDGLRFATAEHYMMWSKARLFEDGARAAEVLEAPSPAAAKRIGRSVSKFDEGVWKRHRFDIVSRASAAKFGQHAQLGAFLLGTKDRVLVEASPRDRIWGIGLAADDERAENPLLWRGLNLLGFALMQARAALAGSAARE